MHSWIKLIIMVLIAKKLDGAVTRTFANLPTCGKPTNPPSNNKDSFTRIAGGLKAQPRSWPFMASGQIDGSGGFGLEWEHDFGAIIVNDQWLLTAAHTVSSPGEADLKKILRFVVGTNDLKKATPVNTFRVSRIILHPKSGPTADGQYDNDIALVKLDKKMQWSADVQPACLPLKNDIYEAIKGGKVEMGSKGRRICYAAGWGAPTDGPTAITVTDLRQTQLEVYNSKDCNVCSAQEIKAGFDNDLRSTCQGDSGGPLACDDKNGVWTVYGTLSGGYGKCGQPNKYSVYTDIFKYKDWISDVLAKN